MEESNIKLWFKKAFEAGKSVQKQEHAHIEVDGRAVWGTIEKRIGSLRDVNLTDESDVELRYNSSLLELYEQMDEIIKKFGMGLSEFCPKSNHFFMQLKNLVVGKSNFIIQLNRVAQLGFNAGQLRVFVKKNTLCEDRRMLIRELVEKYKMFDLDTYIDTSTQKLINTKYLDGTEFDLTKELSGGGVITNYEIKYKKYKTKYLELKSKKSTI
jgi:hypothetical protein